MKKKYNIFIISRLYLKNYYKYLVSKTNIKKSNDAYELFMYCMKKMYGLDAFEYNTAIEKYGDECIKVLKNTKDTPTNLKNVSFDERVKIVSVCEGYAKAIGLFTSEFIRNSRVED